MAKFKKTNILLLAQMWYYFFGVLPMMAETREWLGQAEYDFSVAEAMFDAGKYIYAIYMCQLAVEKALKAIVTQRTGETPPRSHKLIYLAEIGQPHLDEHHREFLGILDAIGTSARYPKDLAAVREAYSRKLTQDYLARTKELLEWLKRDPILKPPSVNLPKH